MRARTSTIVRALRDMWRFDRKKTEEIIAVDQATHLTSIVSPVTDMPADISHALESLIQSIRSGDDQIAPYFSTSSALIAARAPGRLDVMGGIADYSGSTVLQLPLQESTVVLGQHCHKPEFRVVSQSIDNGLVVRRVFCMPMSDFFEHNTGQACSERQMNHYFSGLTIEQQWAAYVAGVLSVLLQHSSCDATAIHGVVLHVSSTVPLGKGVSSSAALEVATMRAMCGLYGLALSAHQQALLCQRVENHIVGAPCGLMDQMASSCGLQGTLLNMCCQPDIVNAPVELPEQLSLWGIDSGIRHAVSGADYGSVRVAAFMGYRYILEVAGIADRKVPAVSIKDSRWHGYLANVSVSEYLQEFESMLPDHVTGRDFLQRFDATTDTITNIDPDVVYAVRACTAHPVYEHFRARLFAKLAITCQHADDIEPLATLMGECMYQSHASYSNCGLDSAGTDSLVARLKTSGVSEGIFGARITGGGSGGVVAVLARSDADNIIRSIAADYAISSKVGGYVFSGSSNGAEMVCLLPTNADQVLTE